MVWLKSQGSYGLERIADAAQVSRSTVLDAYFGRRGVNRRQASTEQTIRETHAQRILAVTPEQINAAFRPATGTLRRLRALVAVGYTETEIAERMGVLRGNFAKQIHGYSERVTAATYEAACLLFQELWSQPKTGKSGDRARELARSHGWVGPLAWDDIDDPDEVPNVRGPSNRAVEAAPLIDETAVELALSGERVRLTVEERRAAVARAHEYRWSDARIAETLRLNDRTVLRIRGELHLEAWPSEMVIGRNKAA